MPKANPQAQLEPAYYKPIMDFIWGIFGEDNVVYAGRSKESLDILKDYTIAKVRAASEKFFWKNLVQAFRWVKRDPRQPQLG